MKKEMKIIRLVLLAWLTWSATVSLAQLPSPPTMVTEPPAVIHLRTNEGFTLTAAVAGTPTPTVRWQMSNRDIPGATSLTYNGRDTNYSAGGPYRLIAENTYESVTRSVTSSATVVVVHPDGLYPEDPAPTNATLLAGSTLQQRFRTGGFPPVFFTLRKNGINVPGYVGLAQNVFPDPYSAYHDLAVPNLQPLDSGAYTFVASNTVGGVATSAVFNVSVLASTAPVILLSPTNVNAFLKRGGPSIINARVAYSSYYPVTVQWRSNDVVLSGQSLSNLTLNFTSTQDFNLVAVLANTIGMTTSAVARISVTYAPGRSDTNFVSTNAILGSVTALAALPTGGVLAGGDFLAWGASNRNYLVELATNGAVTPWLGAANGLNGSVTALHRYADGKLLVSGAFFDIGTSPRYSGLLRLNADGSLDGTFLGGSADANRYISHLVSTLAVRGSDGAIAIAGTFTNVAGQRQPSLALLDSNGVFQASFRPSISNSVSQTDPFKISVLAFQDDGKLLVGGNFGMVGSVGRTNIARLNSDGTLDTAFNVLPQGGRLGVRGLLVEPGGYICLTGNFFGIDAPAGTPTQTRVYFARVGSDGTLAPASLPGITGQGILVRQAGGNVIIAGVNLTRVLTNDTLDPFFPGGGFGDIRSGFLNALSFAPDGSLWIGGLFDTVAGHPQWCVARLFMEGAAPLVSPSLGEIHFSAGSFRFRLPTTLGRNYRVEFKLNLTDAVWQVQQTFTGDGADREVNVSIPATAQGYFRTAAD